METSGEIFTGGEEGRVYRDNTTHTGFRELWAGVCNMMFYKHGFLFFRFWDETANIQNRLRESKLKMKYISI
ncbi:MAG: hypothetical protein B6D64_01050 [Bacteroidetes bacterium 4484_276]|nr:MAG: hypothetical protein B6D64_01050 [Bacteroidetes bacterium 4484_276]